MKLGSCDLHKVGILKVGCSKGREGNSPVRSPTSRPGTEPSLSRRGFIVSMQYSRWIQPATRPPPPWGHDHARSRKKDIHGSFCYLMGRSALTKDSEPTGKVSIKPNEPTIQILNMNAQMNSNTRSSQRLGEYKADEPSRSLAAYAKKFKIGHRHWMRICTFVTCRYSGCMPAKMTGLFQPPAE
ncbi:hypothetical protein EDC04DRAFT_1354695 [Pisolithus marmoratus]|nr:hypothetical protein EDC04DRAFT_1354695 [Pisolithus marmoratus]